jgi:hypothetical protein
MSDADLAAFLDLDADPRWPAAIARLAPSLRRLLARMIEIERALAELDELEQRITPPLE